MRSQWHQNRELFRGISYRLSAVLLSSALFWVTAQSQSSQDHTVHHPGENANAQMATPAPSQPTEAQPTPTPGGQTGSPPAVDSGGMKDGMSGMNEHGMGSPPPRELYPSLMNLLSLSPERRSEVERVARERVETGRAQMATAMERMSAAAARADDKSMQEAVAQAREAAAILESGLAAQRALKDGGAPRAVALEWFKREMSLLAPSGAEPATGLFGLPSRWFHLAVIAILTAFLGAMLWMYFHKMRRAAVLLHALSGSEPLLATTPTGAASTMTPNTVRETAAGDGQARVAKPAAKPAAKAWSGQLRVARIFDETPDVKTFRLALPEGGDLLPFSFEPGQFMNVSVSADGEELKRAYSIASSPCCQGWCEITVKHAASGRVSGYLHERVREGDLLHVSVPYGRFTFRGKEAPSVVFIAGGVGITPLMSSIRYLTDQSWEGEIYLIYACANRESIIFSEELERLSRRHPKLHVTILLSNEESPVWDGPRGYVTKEVLLSAVPDIAKRRVHLCGPPPMMDAVRKLLREMGVPSEQVKTELFLSSKPREIITAASVSATGALAQDAHAAVCTFARSGKTAALPPGKTVLEASEEVGVNIDYSCRQGYCGICKTRLLAGRVTMEVEDGLEPEDKAQNIILACQAKSTGDVTVEA